MPRASWSTVRVLLKAARDADNGPAVLQALTTAFIDHYRDRLEYFRLDFAWSQIHGDPQTTRDLILPLFNELTDVVSEKLRRGTDITPLRARQLAVVAWTSAIGLMSALSVTAAAGTGFVHPTNTLLAVINGALEASARDVEPVAVSVRPSRGHSGKRPIGRAREAASLSIEPAPLGRRREREVSEMLVRILSRHL